MDRTSRTEDPSELRFRRRPRGVALRLRRPRDGRGEAALRAGDGHLDLHVAPGAAATRPRLGTLHGNLERREGQITSC